MKRLHRDSSFEISLPDSWAKCGYRHFKSICNVLAAGSGAGDSQTLALLRICGMRFIGFSAVDGEPRAFFDVGKKDFVGIRTDEIAVAASVLEFINMPDRTLFGNGKIAVVIHKEFGCEDLRNSKFGEFLAVDTLYSTLVEKMARSSSDIEDLRRRFTLMLFPDVKPAKLKPWIHTAAMLWYSAFKDYVIKAFSDLFAENNDPADPFAGNAASSVSRAVNAQIRALTKGDITAEEKVLATKTVRALTELNELAREYQEFKAKTKT